jgi:NAD(P)-dependent dehydrogenase (short-subunit alcohol dehydrogenase family)
MAPKNPVAVVTGGARRIGRAIVEDLARNGWAVAIHCRGSRNEAEEMARGIRAAGGEAAVVSADLAVLEETRTVIPQVIDALAAPALLVNCAGVFEFDEVGALDEAVWNHQTTINAVSPIFLAEAFANALPEGMRGNVVNIIDQRVWKPTPHYFSYQMSKSMLWIATRTLAQALAPRVRVNAIGPGPVMKSTRQTDADFARQSAAVPLGAGPALSEFGRTVRYFVEAESVTGQMIALDGGQHLSWQTPDLVEVEGDDA